MITIGRKQSKRIYAYLTIIILIVISLGIYIEQTSRVPVSLSQPPSWNGVTLGDEIEIQAIKQMFGNSTSEEQRHEYSILIYDNKNEWSWERTEIWIKESQVLGVYLRYPNPKPTLEDLVIQFGKPDKVTWAFGRHMRYVIWAKDGLAVEAYANTRKVSWDGFSVLEMLYFVPTDINTFLDTYHPFPKYPSGFAKFNLYSPGKSDIPDTLPEDPFDWSTMPTPRATKAP
jgi:hypothetical protein